MNTYVKKKKFIPLSELCQLLGVKGIKTALEWCDKHQVPTTTVGNKSVADLFFVELELDRKAIVHLKNKYPDHWEALYHCYTHNDRYGFIELAEIKDSSPILKPKTKVQPKSELAKKFAAS
ncbi:hypothetical protein [uncultured Aquimarina sp.]|uniref:hypothetical protein n=1 Tax=uncultured Aquimarina sp. TaxID=575652 RepID=UPI0026354DDE|nr:hypothetical protein [uncultured Aquimarina sp.]